MTIRLFALTCLYGLSAVVLANDAPTCPAPITFALFEHGYVYEKASNTGIDKDIVEELSKRSGCRFELSFKPRARIWLELENGDLMMSGAGIETDQRDTFAWFVRYFTQKNYVLLANSLDIKTADQFAAAPNLRWVAVRSYKHGEKADAFLEKLHQSSRVTEEDNLQTVLSVFISPNRFHSSAIFAPSIGYAKYIKDMNLTFRVRIEDWFPEDQSVPHGLVFSKKYFTAIEIKKWRGIIEKMRTDGTLKTIYKKYLGEVDAERMLQYKAN